MSIDVGQWQAGKQFEGYPPWDGTGFPFPLDGDWTPPERDLAITEPADGATDVDPLVTIRGTGALDGDTVDLYAESSPGAPVASVAAAADGSFEFVGTVPFEVSPETITVGVGDERSPSVTFTLASAAPSMGWTVAELKQFAADHEPPITVPASGTKAEILAAILAYIEAHPDEEN